MGIPRIRLRGLLSLAAAISLSIGLSSAQAPAPDFDRMLRQQAETDRTWLTASQGRMIMEKIAYRSRAGDLDIPAFVFQPLKSRGARHHPALVWVHEDIRGHLYEHYIP